MSPDEQSIGNEPLDETIETEHALESPTLLPSEHGADPTGGAHDPTLPPRDAVEVGPTGQTQNGQLGSAPPVGTTVRYFGDYEIIEEIARGGMGVVYKARQVKLNRIVALKMILAGQLASEKDVQRFYTEAEAAANLDHPGIVPIFEVGQHEGQHYFSMGFVKGESLADQLKDGPLPTREAAELTKKVAEAVAYAHEHGVIHRDLKPANVLLEESGEQSEQSMEQEATPRLSRSGCSPTSAHRFRPRITDFGLAKKLEDDCDLTGTGQILGTPSYMPPEQAAGKAYQVGPAADIYALGAVLYALLSGRPPFQAANPMDTLLQVLDKEPVPLRQLNFNVPRDLETICLKCLEKHPHRRYARAGEVVEELRRFLADEPIRARPISLPARAWRWCRRNPLVAALTVAASAFLVVGAAVSNYFALESSKRAATEAHLRGVAERREGEAREAAERERRAKLDTERALLQVDRSRADAVSTRNDLYTTLGIVSGDQEDYATAALWFAEALSKSTDPQQTLIHRKRLRRYQRRIPTPIAAMHKGASAPVKIGFDASGEYLLATYADSSRKFSGLAVWKVATQKETQLPIEQGKASAASWTDEESHVLIGTTEGECVLVDVSAAKVVRKWTVEGKISGVASSGPADKVAIASADTVSVFDISSAQTDPSIYGHPADVTAVSFNKTGTQFVSSCSDKKARVFRTTSQPGDASEFAVEVLPDQEPIFWKDGTEILVVAPGKELRSVQVGSGEITDLKRVFRPHKEFLGLDASGNRFAAGHGSFQGALFNGDRRFILPQKNEVHHVCFSPTGEELLTAGLERLVYVWDTNSGARKFPPLQHCCPVVRTAYSSIEGEFCTAQRDGLIRVWRSPPPPRSYAIDVNAYGIHARISADKKYLVPCGFGWYRRLHSFAVYETATGKRVSEMLDVQGQLSGGDFSPDGSLFVSLATLEQHQETTRPADWHERQGVVRFWDWQQAKERLAPLRTPSEPLDVRFLSDDRAVVVCAAGHLLIVDLGSGKVAKTLQHPGEAIYYNPAERFLVVSPSGDRFVTCGLGPEAILWRAQDGEIVGALKHDSTVLSAAFGPEGRYVATGSMDAIARVWDASSGQPLSEPLKHTDWVFHCRFSRDGRHLLTASRDYLARLWDWEQAALACPAFGHPDEVFTADFIPETPFIVTSSRFASARFWETHKGTPISPPIDVSGRGPPHRLYAVQPCHSDPSL